MKLDKIKFAKLISYLSRNAGECLTAGEVEAIDDLITFEVPKVSCSDVDYLLESIYHGRKIDAIKAYHTLTGAGLKESKDAVEKYWHSKPVEHATLGDILGQATNK